MAALGFPSSPWHPLAEMTPDEQAREAARLDYQTLMADAADRLKHQVDLGKGLLQSLTLVNGGAIVALFTLIGKQGDGLALDPMLLKRAFGFFIAGLILSLISGSAGFLSQLLFAGSSTLQAWEQQDVMLGRDVTKRHFQKPFKQGGWALVATIAAAILSAACFGLGSWSALSGVLDQSTTVVAPA